MRNIFKILCINLIIWFLFINFVFAQTENENILLVPDDLQTQIIELSSNSDGHVEYPEVVDGYQKIVLPGGDNCQLGGMPESVFIMYAPVSIGADYSGFQILIKTNAGVSMIFEKEGGENIDYDLIKATDDDTKIGKDGDKWGIIGNDDITILQLNLQGGRTFQGGVYYLKLFYTIHECEHLYRLPVRVDDQFPDNWPEHCGYNAWIDFDDLSYDPVNESFKILFRAGFLEDMTINIEEFYKNKNGNVISPYNIQGRSNVDNVECFYELNNPDNFTLDYSNNVLQISRERPSLNMQLRPDEEGIFEGEFLLNIGGPNSGQCLSSALESLEKLSIGISCENSSNICCREKDFDISDFQFIDLSPTMSFKGCQDFEEGTAEYNQCLIVYLKEEILMVRLQELYGPR